MFNFEKQRPVSDAECTHKSNGTICFSVRGLEPPPPKKKSRLIYDVKIRRHVVERNLAFGGQKIDVLIRNFVLWWALASCLTYNTVL